MAETGAKNTKHWVLALASVASFMTALDTLVVTTALTTIRHDLGASMEALQWTANAYNLTFAVWDPLESTCRHASLSIL